jgi:hypothetical protein
MIVTIRVLAKFEIFTAENKSSLSFRTELTGVF